MTAGGEVARLGAALRAGELTVAELTERTLGRAEALQETVGAFAELTPELARRQAARAQEELGAGLDRGPLHGLPISVKDVIDVAGVATRLGTRGAGHKMPAAHAGAVDALTSAGAVVIGKATTHEIAFGMVTPATRNPLDPARIVGGSSGGSAASVAAGLAVGSLGTDTSGSVRCPAALCGVVGLKPTYGSLSRSGVAPLAPSQDTVGILAATAADCAELWSLLSAPAPLRADGAAGLRLGVDRDLLAQCEPGVAAAVDAALDGLAAAGAQLIDVHVRHVGLSASASVLVMLAEAAAAWGAELDRRPMGFGPVARAALAAGRDVSAADLERGHAARDMIRDSLDELLDAQALDGLLTPTLPVTAALAGQQTVDVAGRTLPVEAAHARFTSLASVTGHPAISIPCGLGEDGLPAGLQAIGRPGGEEVLLGLAAAVETQDGARAVADARRACQSPT